MTNLKHTPAPWRVHHSHGWLVVESDNEEMFVQVKKGIGSDKDLANARLIAAAPELLEVLQFYANPEVYKPDSTGRTMDITDVAREAIFKATGEQP